MLQVTGSIKYIAMLNTQDGWNADSIQAVQLFTSPSHLHPYKFTRTVHAAHLLFTQEGNMSTKYTVLLSCPLDAEEASLTFRRSAQKPPATGCWRPARSSSPQQNRFLSEIDAIYIIISIAMRYTGLQGPSWEASPFPASQ